MKSMTNQCNQWPKILWPSISHRLLIDHQQRSMTNQLITYRLPIDYLLISLTSMMSSISYVWQKFNVSKITNGSISIYTFTLGTLSMHKLSHVLTVNLWNLTSMYKSRHVLTVNLWNLTMISVKCQQKIHLPKSFLVK